MHSSNKANDRTDGKSRPYGRIGPTQSRIEKREASKGVRRQARGAERSPDPDAINRPIHGSDWWD